MVSSIQKAIRVVFLSATIIFTAFILYTTNVYFIVFRGIRSFEVASPRLQIALNSSNISATTNITIQNPSELTFELRQIREVLFLNGEFVLTQTVSTLGLMQIEPRSVSTFMIEAEVPLYKVAYVQKNVDGFWGVYVRLFLDAPLVDGYSWSNSWVITEVVKAQMNADQGFVISAR